MKANSNYAVVEILDDLGNLYAEVSQNELNTNSLVNESDWILEFLVENREHILKIVDKKLTSSFLNGRHTTEADEIINSVYLYAKEHFINSSTDKRYLLEKIEKLNACDLGISDITDNRTVLFDITSIDDHNDIFCTQTTPEDGIISEYETNNAEIDDEDQYTVYSKLAKATSVELSLFDNNNTELDDDNTIIFAGKKIRISDLRKMFSKMTVTQRQYWRLYLEFMAANAGDESKCNQTEIVKYISKRIGKRIARQSIFTWDGALMRGLAKAGLIDEPTTHREKAILKAQQKAKENAIPMPDIQKEFAVKYPAIYATYKQNNVIFAQFTKIAKSACELPASRTHAINSNDILRYCSIKQKKLKFNNANVDNNIILNYNSHYHQNSNNSSSKNSTSNNNNTKIAKSSNSNNNVTNAFSSKHSIYSTVLPDVKSKNNILLFAPPAYPTHIVSNATFGMLHGTLHQTRIRQLREVFADGYA